MHDVVATVNENLNREFTITVVIINAGLEVKCYINL